MVSIRECFVLVTEVIRVVGGSAKEIIGISSWHDQVLW